MPYRCGLPIPADRYGVTTIFRQLLIWLALCVLPVSANANSPSCRSACYVSIGEWVSMALVARDLPLASVSDGSVLFKPSQQQHPAIGYTQQALWLRLDAQRVEPGTYLVIENANLNSVTLYQHDQRNGWQSLTQGTHHPFKDRPIKARALVFPVLATVSPEFPVYVKVVSATSLTLPVYIATYDRMLETFALRDTLSGIFIGILLAFACYHLVIYFVVQHVSYLYFSLSVVLYVIFLASIEGFVQQWVFYEFASENVNRCLLTSYAVSSFFFNSFLKAVVKTRQFLPMLHRLLGVLQVGLLLMVPAIFWVDYAIMGPFSVYYSAVVTLVGAIATLAIAWQGYRPARWFVVMWALFVLAATFRSLRLLGYSPVVATGDWWLQMGSVVGFLFLALALAQRIRMIKDAEHKALQYAMDVEQSAKYDLEKKVEQRTKALKIEKSHLEYLNDARTKFFTHANHEIRTPVTAILQYVSFLQRGVGCRKPDQKEAAYLDVVYQHAQRIHALTNQWLDLEKVQALEAQAALSDISITDCIASSINKLAALFRPGVVLDYSVQAGCEVVRANRDFLESILENLLSNAAKYTQNGDVSIQVEHAVKSGLVKIWVIDSGPGVAVCDQLRIFQPFEQGVNGEKYEGTGLGLSLCKAYVTRMGGEIGVKNTPAGGAAFWFTLTMCE